jgi:purine-nucleoside/S-methyl-5'-thioadenosine phosphorylase / adenosine deaminase
MINIVENSHCKYLSFEFREKIPGFLCLTTLRKKENPPAKIIDLEKSLSLAPGRIAGIKQIHSDKILEIPPDGNPHKQMGEADGIILKAAGMSGIIRTADCVPVILVHPESKMTALIHAGWKGTCSGITRKAALRMLELTSGSPEELKVFAGPCIHSCCYEVGTEVAKAFAEAGHDLDLLMDGKNLDLVKANLSQAVDLGITDISSSGFCTACNPELFYSYRRDKTAGRMLTMAGFIS